MVYVVSTNEQGESVLTEFDDLHLALIMAKGWRNPSIIYWNDVQSFNKQGPNTYWSGWVVIEMNIYRI